MRLVLLGAPGSGKSTQANLLAEQLNIPQISTTDLLKTAVEVQTPLGRQASAILSTGQHLPNELVFGMIRERLSNPDALNGFILDGFPRNIEQARELDALLNSLSMPIQKTIIIDANPDILSSRLSDRLICEDCNEIFNRQSNTSIMEQQCSKCEGPLQEITDDTENSFDQRMLSYKSQIQDIMDFYDLQNKLTSVDGNGDIKSTYHAMKLIFKSILLSSSIKKPTDNTATSPITRAVTKTKAPVQSTMNSTSDSTKAPSITANSSHTEISNKKTPTATDFTAITDKAENIHQNENALPENTLPSTTENAKTIESAACKTETTDSIAEKTTTDKTIETKTNNIVKKRQTKEKSKTAAVKPTNKMNKVAKQKTVTKKKSVTKKSQAKQATAKKTGKQDKNNLQTQLKQLKTELKQIKAETIQIEKRNQKLIKLAIESNLIRKQFSTKWEKDAIKILKDIK